MGGSICQDQGDSGGVEEVGVGGNSFIFEYLEKAEAPAFFLN